MVIIFESSDVADEWWRAVSTSTIKALAGNINRVTPQFYTYNVDIWNVYYFFTETTIKSISDVFRGKMILVLENDRVGRGMSIIPPQVVVETTSGNW